MTSTTAPNMEDQIGELLGELSHLQEELLEVLTQKRDLIATNQMQAAADLQPQMEQLCERLQTCHTKRSDLLASSQEQGNPAESLGELVSSLPLEERGGLAKQVKEAGSRGRLLQHHSLANWVLAQRSILHLSQMLEIIATGGQLQPTYGSTQNHGPSGALVDGEA